MNFLSGNKFATKSQLFIHSAYQKSMLSELLLCSPPVPKGAIFFFYQKIVKSKFFCLDRMELLKKRLAPLCFQRSIRLCYRRESEMLSKTLCIRNEFKLLFIQSTKRDTQYCSRQKIYHQYSGQQYSERIKRRKVTISTPPQKNYLLILTCRITQQTKSFCAERGLELWPIKMGILFIEQTKFLVFSFSFDNTTIKVTAPAVMLTKQ